MEDGGARRNAEITERIYYNRGILYCIMFIRNDPGSPSGINWTPAFNKFHGAAATTPGPDSDFRLTR